MLLVDPFDLVGLMLICVGAIAGWLFIRAREKEFAAADNAASLLKQLNVASVMELPRIVLQVRAEPRTRKLLVAQYESAPLDSMLRNRAGISLLPFDASVVNRCRVRCIGCSEFCSRAFRR